MNMQILPAAELIVSDWLNTSTPISLPNKSEVLQLVVDDAPTSVAMHELAWVGVQTAGARFESLDFTEGQS